MKVVDRANPMPLWAQIEADLRAQIASGRFEERFPTDGELMASYGVSRQTVREAVRRLQAEGLLERQRGRGTTVSRPVLEQPLGAMYSLALAVTGHGLSEHNEVRAAGRCEPDAEVRSALGLGDGDAVLFLERLRFAGREPLALERSWMPWSLAHGLVRADLEHGPLQQELRERCGVTVTSGSERISPVIPPAEDRRLLRLPARAAAFSVERRTFADGRPVELRRSTVRGDRYRFVMEWPTR